MKLNRHLAVFGLIFFFSSCAPVKFKDVEITKLETVSTTAQAELKSENHALIGDRTLKIYFTSKTDFSEYGLKKQGIRGPLSVNAHICGSEKPLAMFSNDIDATYVSFPDLFFDSTPLNRWDAPKERVEALDNEQLKTFYFFAVIAKKKEYDLADRPHDLCFKMTALNGFASGVASKRIMIDRDKVKKALERQ